MRNKKIFNQRGVTLIELLAVIVILGIISAVAVPAVLTQINNSKTNTDAANLKILQDAVDRYAAYNGNYPTDLNALTTSTGTDGGPYLKAIPTIQSGNGAGTINWSYDKTTGQVSHP